MSLVRESGAHGVAVLDQFGDGSRLPGLCAPTHDHVVRQQAATEPTRASIGLLKSSDPIRARSSQSFSVVTRCQEYLWATPWGVLDLGSVTLH